MELRSVLPSSGLSQIRSPAGRNGVDYRIHMHESCSRVDLPDRVAPGDGGAHELAFNFPAASLGVRENVSLVDSPGQKRYLVDGAEKRNLSVVFANKARYSLAVAREPIDECRAEKVHVIRPPVMA